MKPFVIIFLATVELPQKNHFLTKIPKLNIY